MAFLRRLVGRLGDVIIDGLVQAAVVALVIAVITIAWAWRGHIGGVWLERAIGALGASLVIALILDLLGLYRELVKSKRQRQGYLQLEKGFLDHKLDAENAMTDLPSVINKLGAIMSGVGPFISKSTEALKKAPSTKDQLAVSKLAARRLDKYSARLDKVLLKYEQLEVSLSSGLEGWSKWIESSGVDRTGLATLNEGLRQLVANTKNSIDKMQEYIDSMNGNRGASRDFNAAIERHVKPMGNIMQVQIRMRNSCANALSRFEGPPG